MYMPAVSLSWPWEHPLKCIIMLSDRVRLRADQGGEREGGHAAVMHAPSLTYIQACCELKLALGGPIEMRKYAF